METVANSNIRRNFLPPPFLPYNYQIPIIKDMVQTVLEGKSGLVIQPTATGKSVEAAFTARACILLHNMKGLYLYNENEGLEQARIKFTEIFAGNDVVCASFFGYGRDQFVHEADMLFASFQSLNYRDTKWYTTFQKDHFDFVIVNEAHHSQAETYKEVIEYFDCAKIGMTATEKRMDGKDIRDLFPNIICEILLEEAIVNQWVAEIEYHVLSSGLSTQKLKQICREVLEEGKRISIKQLNETIFIELLDAEMLNEVYKYSFPLDEDPRQTLLFCENINHAKHVVGILQNDRKLVGSVHSKQSDAKNRSVMKDFREGNIQFLVSIDKLNEDIDIPEAEVGVLIRATDSETIFYQQIGRLLRRTKRKKKAIILDFVANVDRLIIIQQMVKNVEDMALKFEQDLFQRSLMHVSGEGFNFLFNEELRNILSVLRVLRDGLYPTWREASVIAISGRIQSSREYEKKYKVLDARMPASPSSYYQDFPGWNVFLNRKVVPKGWFCLAKLLPTSEFIHARVSMKKFVLRCKSENSKLVGNYWSENGEGSYSAIHIHPKLVKECRKLFSGRKPAPQGWKSYSRLSRENNVSIKVLQDFFKEYRISKPQWFKHYLSKSAYVECCHPKLVKLVVEKFKILSLPPTGWKTIKNFISDYEQISHAMAKQIAHYYHELYPDLYEIYETRIGLRLIDVEYYHPDFIKLLEVRIDEMVLAPEGWVTINSNTFKQTSKAQEIAESYREGHPEWFKMWCVNTQYREHIHPDLVVLIKSQLSETYVWAPTGWATCYKIAENYGKGVKWTRVKKEADKYREAHPEWFKFYRINNHQKEHYHPYLIALLHNELVKILPSPTGWKTINKIRQEKDVTDSSSSMQKFVDQFRSSHPQWFEKYMANNYYVEHCHPDLVQKIKEQFGKKKE